jgi:hypothetical protein
MLPAKARYLAVVLLAAAVYFILVYCLNGWIWGVAPGREALQSSLGRLAGARVWAHFVHAVALLLAAVPSALLLSWFCRPYAVHSATIAGAITVVASFAPTFLEPSVRSILDTTILTHMTIDSIKFVVILALLTWLANKLPSKNATQRLSRVGTSPLIASVGPRRIVRSEFGETNDE